MIVFVYADTRLRLQRLQARESARFGKANPEFLRWAESYDCGTSIGRNLQRHRDWLAKRTCKTIELDGARPVASNVEEILQALSFEFGHERAR